MKVLILGGNGMLGHKLLQQFKDKFEVWITLRNSGLKFSKYNLINPEFIFDNLNIEVFSEVRGVILKFKPDVIINAVGVIKQHENLADKEKVWQINAEFPHLLGQAASEIDARLICISTDCVFDGSKGNYSENDSADAKDLYGISKLTGEVVDNNSLTVRTSIIGRELDSRNGLVEWFFSQEGQKIKGYANAFFSGFPTIIFADILADIIENHQDLRGLYHIASSRISKFELLKMIKNEFDCKIEIEPDVNFRIDRSLNGGKFRLETGFVPLDWETMIRKMSNDPFSYHKFNR